MGKCCREDVLCFGEERRAERRKTSKGVFKQMEKRKFTEQVYQLCRQIPKGKVTTYREIAAALGTKGYQAIGQVLKRNQYAPTVPCHRVVKSDGDVSGYYGSEYKKIREKIKKLAAEGVKIVEGKVDLRKCLFRF